MPTFRDLLNTARARITEVLPAEAAEHAEDTGGPWPLTCANRTSSSRAP